MRINSVGKLVDEPTIRAGFIGCGSHAFRNIYPALQFAPVNLVAVCDLDVGKAQTYAKQFGAERAYSDHKEMLAREQLDAVFMVTSYDERGRPRYPQLATDALNAGCHVWMEKPAAATCAEVLSLNAVAKKNGKIVVCGMKKMFMPIVRKARELMTAPEFGEVALVTLQYPQRIPPLRDLQEYLHEGKKNGAVTGFLDHIVHPAAQILALLGAPQKFSYQTANGGSGIAVFGYPSGVLVSCLCAPGLSSNGGFERTLIVSAKSGHIVLENNVRLSYHRNPPTLKYGASADYFQGGPGEVTATWEPECSLGNIYNKQLFLQGFHFEITEFAQAILEKRNPTCGGLRDIWSVTRIFEAFAEGPGHEIALGDPPAELLP